MLHINILLHFIFASIRPNVNASTLSFFLVMPVQRIARYPLLLQTIQKHTDTQHPAYPLLEHTAHTAVQLNCRINEYKRFREVGEDLTSVLETFTASTPFAYVNMVGYWLFTRKKVYCISCLSFFSFP